MPAWNGWYHVNIGTYGTWLKGDRRGWRSRHHRTHVEGDYKNPPPAGEHEQLLRQSSSLLRNSAVLLTESERKNAGRAMVEMLIDQDVQVLALAMDAVHCHMLAKFGDLPARQAVGRAKKHAYHMLRGDRRQGRIWAKRGRTLPITDRSHQLNVYQYILQHAQAGAWVWTYKEGLYWRK